MKANRTEFMEKVAFKFKRELLDLVLRCDTQYGKESKEESKEAIEVSAQIRYHNI